VAIFLPFSAGGADTAGEGCLAKKFFRAFLILGLVRRVAVLLVGQCV
jgi:hypothetical protein